MTGSKLLHQQAQGTGVQHMPAAVIAALAIKLYLSLWPWRGLDFVEDEITYSEKHAFTSAEALIE